MSSPAFENVRPEVPAFLVGVDDVAKIIDQHQIEVARPPDERLKQPVIPVHRPSEHRLRKGDPKIQRKILVLRYIQDRIFLKFVSWTCRIFQDVNILQNRTDRAEITELIEVADRFTETPQIDHRAALVRCTETLADLAEKRGIHLKARCIEILDQMLIAGGQFGDRIADGLQFSLSSDISTLLGKQRVNRLG